jgi:lysyl endopeptidase
MYFLSYLSSFNLSKTGWGIFIALILANLSLQAQVRTYILGPEENLSDYLPFYVQDQPAVKVMPAVDVAAVLEEDRRLNRRLHRYGIKIDGGFTELDGEWYDSLDLSAWKLRISSYDAIALNFHFNNLHMPEGSEMYLYSLKRNMIAGPILPKHPHNGSLTTDQIFGEEVTILVFLPRSDKDKFSITVEEVIHAFEQPQDHQRGYGDSENCNNNINCPLGDTWQDERDAVCLILVGEDTGSGTLVNNDCQNLSPYLLTANHIVENGTEDPDEWVFRFNYDSPTSTCHGDQGEPQTWQSFTGADLLASWEDSDFALLELFDPIEGNPDLALAGWNRSSSVPDSSTIIHHPDGDVKKITIDAGAAVIEDDAPVESTLADNHAFRLEISNDENGDDGIVEPGSSGSAMFTDLHRVVGQLWGGQSNYGCESTTDSWYGRIYNSWTGGGSSNNRLSDWLGGNGNPTTLNTIRVFFDNITGDNVLCTSNEDYTLEDTIPGKSTSWSVTPTYLFGSSTSGSGATATLKAASSTTSGEATLTFEMSDGCSTQEGERTIWVGIPGLNTATVDGETPTTPTYIDNPAYLVVTAKGDPSSYSWSIESGSGSIYPSGNTCVAYAYPFVIVKATATNICGSNAIYYFYLQQSGSPRLPANFQVTTQSEGNYRLNFLTDLSEMRLNGMSIADQFGRIVMIYEKSEIESLLEAQTSIDIDLSHYPIGVFYFTLYFDKDVITKKLVHW